MKSVSEEINDLIAQYGSERLAIAHLLAVRDNLGDLLAKMKSENKVMYAAILEAATLGVSAALRCKVELQRIAKKESE